MVRRPLIGQLITTKLHPPALPLGAVPRQRLIDGAGLVPQRPLTLVTAPAGFGKSTLLSQWHHGLLEEGVPAGWLSLDAEDDAPAPFMTYLVAALQQVRPSLGAGLFVQLLTAPPEELTALALPMLVNDLAGLRHPCVLFIDDFHLVRDPAIHGFIAALLRRRPAALRLVMAGRSTPPLPLARLRAADAVWEMTAADLRFTAPEAARFLHAIPALGLSGEEIERLQARTEGWAAGLRLAALSVGQGGRDAAWPEEASGRDPAVTAFFMDEILRGLPASVQDFLVRTSILDRLGAGLCDAVTGRSDGAETLERLVRDNVFTLPVDPERRWFRYHQLFAEFLRERAHAVLGAELATLHRAASSWFERNGLAREAVRHALAAGDMESAAAIIEERCLSDYLSYGLFKTYHSWMALLPEAVRRRRPLLQLLHVWSHINDRDYAAADATLRRVEAQLPPDPGREEGPGALRLAGRVRLFDCLNAAYSGDMARFALLCEELRETVLDDGPFGQVDLDSILSYGQLNFGSLDEAQRLTWKAHERYARIACWWGLIHSRSIAGMAALASGRLRDATRLFESSLQFARSHFEGASYMIGLPSVLLGATRYETGALDAAEPLLRAGIMQDPRVDRVGLDDRQVVGYGHLARLLATTGRAAEAFAILDRGEQFGFETDNRRLIVALRTERARLYLLAGRIGEAQAESDRVMAQLAEESGRMPPFAWQVWEPAQILRAQINLARRRTAAALDTLGRLAEAAQRQGRLRSLIVLRAALATGHAAQGAREDAGRLLAAALSAACERGFVRALVDLGPDFAQLLAMRFEPLARQAEGAGWLDGLRRLVAATGAEPAGGAGGAEPGHGPPAATDLLSDRERQVMQLVARGLPNRDIGSALGIREQTVKTHLKNVFAKLGVASRTQAAAALRAQGLLLP